MTDPQVPIQSDASRPSSPTAKPRPLVRAVGPFGAAALHGGDLVTIDHKGVGAMAARTHHVELPVTAVAAVALTEPTAAENGRLDLTVRTTEGDSHYDPQAPNPFSMTFTARQLDDFRAVAEAIDAARPLEPVAIEPPKPERKKPFWRRGAFWTVVALVAVVCCLVNSCGGSDDSATESMPNVVGMSYAQAQLALDGYTDVDYVDANGFPVTSGAVTGQKPKAGTKVSHSAGITVTVDPLGKTKEQKAREAAQKKAEQLRQQAENCKDKNAADVIAELDAKGLTGTIKTDSNAAGDQADTVRGGIASGTAYTVTDATVDDGKIDLVVDTAAHHNRELAKQQIPGLCSTAGQRAYPYGFKVPMFSASGDVTFTDDTNWTYTFEANITNAFGATAKHTPVTCTGTLVGQDIEVTGIN